MTANRHSILLIGESNVGKTHYGAQFLKRLLVHAGSLKMVGSSNLTPFTQALERLSEGRATDHTPATTYTESVWSVADHDGREAQLVWPDYGGEQVRNLVVQRKIPSAWRDRVLGATDWVLLVRLHTMRSQDDLFSRPLDTLGQAGQDTKKYEPSDQARAIELLQILLYLAGLHLDRALQRPSITVLLSCWDELQSTQTPPELLAARLPMFSDFLKSNWAAPTVMGLSALERALSTTNNDPEYETKGPEGFGYVILPDGSRNDDITLPVTRLLTAQD